MGEFWVPGVTWLGVSRLSWMGAVLMGWAHDLMRLAAAVEGLSKVQHLSPGIIPRTFGFRALGSSHP